MENGNQVSRRRGDYPQGFREEKYLLPITPSPLSTPLVYVNAPESWLYFWTIGHCNLSIYILCLSVCLFVCLSVYIRQPIEPNFFVGPRLAPGKVYGWSNFQKFAYIKILFFTKSAKFLYVFVLQCTQREHNGKGRWARSVLKA